MGARIRRLTGSSPRSITRIWSAVRHVFRTHGAVGLHLPDEVGSLAGDRGDDPAGEKPGARIDPGCRYRRLLENARIDLLVERVTGAGRALETAHIEDGEVAPAVPNELAPLQRARRTGHA